MKLSVCEETGPPPPDCVGLLMELTPLVWRVLRSEVRHHEGVGLSMPQFRVLGLLHRHPGASLSDTAERGGLTLSSASKLVDTLIARDLVTRAESASDRRRVTLTVTAEGEAVLDAAQSAGRARLAEALASLSEAEQSRVAEALQLLRPLLERTEPWESQE